MSSNGSTMSKILTLFIVIGLVSGCASGGSKRLSDGISSGVEPMNALDNLQAGDSVVHGGESLTVGRPYFAASGRTCKILQRADGSQRAACRDDSNGRWYLRKPLNISNSTSTVVPVTAGQTVRSPSVSESIVPVSPNETTPVETGVEVPLPVEMPVELSSENALTEIEIPDAPTTTLSENPQGGESFEVESGETLWKFSRRVTGNALNWERIADANGMDDVRVLRAGDYLFVPNDLLSTANGR